MIVSDVDGLMCDYKEKPVEGRISPRDTQRIVLPGEPTTHPRIPMDISDYDSEEEIIKVLEEKRREEDKFIEELTHLQVKGGDAFIPEPNWLAPIGGVVTTERGATDALEILYRLAQMFGFGEEANSCEFEEKTSSRNGGVTTNSVSAASGGARWLTVC